MLDAKDLLHPIYRGRTDLVVLVGSDLVSDKYVTLAGHSNAATERVAFANLLTNKRLGGMPVVEPPFFPKGAFLITTLENLSIYVQNGTRRRHLKDNPSKDQVEDYQSVNECYVIEAYQACAFYEGIQVPNGANDAWIAA